MPSANHPATGAAAGRESRPNDEPTVLVRKLGSANVPTYLERVLTRDGEHQFVVVERLSRGSMTEDETSECMREARIAAGLEHPNVVRTRAITVRPDEISVTSDYVAGERLSELWGAGAGSEAALPLEIALRILVDVATGLGALHKLRIEEGHERVKFVHGEVTGESVLVGLDGVSLLLRSSRVRRKNGLPKTGIGTLAPEVLAGEAADQHADIYSLGALLWQALSGRPLFSNVGIDAILASVEQGPVARAVVTRHAPWALPLADVAARALAPVPDKRFPTASSMVTELRKIAGPKLATAVEVAEFVEAAAGEKIAARLADVQASAVIRRATSIPAPRSVPAPATAIVEPESGPSEPGTQDEETGVVTAPIEALAIAPKEIPVSASLSPATEVARPQAFPEPPSEPQKPTAPAAEPTDRSSPSPLPAARPVTKARPVVKARPVAKARPAAKAPQAVRAPAPTPSPLALPRIQLAIGAWLALALVTGWFVLRAIRNRQDIVTPGATLVETSAMLTPASSDVAGENGAARPGVLAASPMKSAPGTTSTARARPPAPSEPHQAPTTKLRQK